MQHLTLNSALAQDQYQPILFQNTPNPFNASTIVAFDLPKSQETTLKVMDMTGKQVFNVVMSGQKVEMKSSYIVMIFHLPVFITIN